MSEQTKPFALSLPSLNILEISGQDAKKFLQGQATCDLNKLTPNQGLLGALCNLKGRAYASFYLVERLPHDHTQAEAEKKPSESDNSTLWLIIHSSIIESTLSTLRKYSPFFQADLKRLADHSITGTVSDNSSKPALSAFNVEQTNHELSLALPSQQLNNGHSNHNNQSRTLKIGNPSTPPESNKEHLDAQESLWSSLDILHGALLVDARNREAYIPIELDYDKPALQGIHFDKGCYTGQEIIARLHYRGETKYRLVAAMALVTEQIAEQINALCQDQSFESMVKLDCHSGESHYKSKVVSHSVVIPSKLTQPLPVPTPEDAPLDQPAVYFSALVRKEAFATDNSVDIKKLDTRLTLSSSTEALPLQDLSCQLLFAFNA